MRTSLYRLNSRRIPALIILLLCAMTPKTIAAVGVTISPNLVTNDYLGKISITVTGLAAGKTIRVEKFADFNTNGVINPAEAAHLWRSFTVTDGQLPLLGGATNLNVAGDMDGLSNGTILAELFFPGSDGTVDQFGAKYLYRITDPAGSFAFTNSFEVRQKVYPQGVSGRVLAAGSGTPLTNGMVIVMPLSAPGGWGATINTGGYFTVYSPPGSYMLWSANSGYVSGVAVTVNSNVMLTRNLTNSAATFTISGKISDNSSGAGLPGIIIFGQLSGSTTAFSTTDTNGNYSLGVTAGQWRFQIPQAPLAQLGYVGFNAITSNVSSNISNANIVASKATALIYGRIMDASGNPLPKITFSGEDSANQYETDALSFPINGEYAMGTLAGQWCLGPNDDDPNLTGLPVPEWQCATLTNGESRQINFFSVPCGMVQITSASPLPAAEVGSYYDFPFQAAAGCHNNFNWSVNDPANVPSGLTLWSDGPFNGEPNSPGDYTFSVHVDDGLGHSTNKTFSIHIAGAVVPLQVDTSWLPDGTMGVLYSQTLAASGGQPPYQWSIAPFSADLPANLVLGTNGVLSGIPAASGTFYFYARVTDATTATSDSSLLSLTFASLPFSITTVSLPQVTVGLAYHAQLGASGGQHPYKCWALAPGSASLPPGLTLNCNGSITGTPTNSGIYHFIVQATDNNNATATKALGIRVISKPSLSLPDWFTNRFQARLNGATGQTYTIQYSTTLTNWTDLLVTNSGPNLLLLVTDPAATNARRFYRVVIYPNGSTNYGTLLTPYVNESDIATMNEAYSSSANAPWGFAHDGIDFMPNGDGKAFRAAGSGVVQTVDLWQNGVNWQVNVWIQHDSVTGFDYIFEPMSPLQAHGQIQRSNIVVTAGQPVAAGDLLGYLHTTDSSSHVHFSVRTNYEADCPEPYFTDEARQSILRVLHQTYPGANMCY